jgi:hypothetical protein
MQAVDKNRDGQVDFEEFLLLMKESVLANPGGKDTTRQGSRWHNCVDSCTKKAQIARKCIFCCC